ncbi:hypothetical protein V8B97DRAFT_816833 [Scleroderma yunnanense]
MLLQTLPYDLLFHIAQYLDIDDVHNLQTTCKSLRTFTLTRPVYRSLAYTLLSRSRPLPLPAFQRLADLSTQSLISAVNRANRFEKAWRIRAPRPAIPSSLSTTTQGRGRWYTKISAPPNEEIDWLSPITSSYTLCATKSGRVVCWDVARDICLAEWDPRTLTTQFPGFPVFSQNRKGNEDDGDNVETRNEKKWELWKCRVEFDERAVYFTMARVLRGSYDDDRVMEFVLMKLSFPPETPEHASPDVSPTWNSPPIPCDASRPKTPPILLPASEAPSLHESNCLAATGPPSTTTSACCSPVSSRVALPTDSYYAVRQQYMNTYGPRDEFASECSCAISPAHSDAMRRNAHTSELPTISQECPLEPSSETGPLFFPLTSFYTTGVVMNVFLLDPPRCLLSAFVWVASSNTIGLYVLLDWTNDEYVFVDTGVGCLISSNWSCILHEDQIVIHSEEADAAYQYFYPLSILRTFTRSRRKPLSFNGHNNTGNVISAENMNTDSQPQVLPHVPRHDLPVISTRLPPVKSLSKKFVFPRRTPSSTRDMEPNTVEAFFTLRGIGVNQTASSDDPLAETITEPSSAGPSGHRSNDVDNTFSGMSTGETGAETSTAVAEGSSKGKGKARAVEGDTIAEDKSYSPAPESSRQKGKGRMKEATPDIQEWPEESEVQSHPSTSSLSSTPATQDSIVVQQPTALVPVSQSPDNPYPFPPWYPESAHFVRQWWPTLPGVPRLSCTVVLLAAHDPNTHRTRFVLAQHYFRVPIVHDPVPDTGKSGSISEDDEMLHLWYVSTPFEVVCVLDPPADNDEEEDTGDRPRPLVAVDFGHAVWVEYAAEPGGVYGVDASRLVSNSTPNRTSTDSDEEDGSEGGGASTTEGLFEGLSNGTISHELGTDSHDGDGTILDPRRHRVPKCLRFVTFPPVYTAYDKAVKQSKMREEAVVRTLDIPQELDLDGVETINIDQSQGAVILSVKEGNIFILRYE